jgi:hypothetical protein
LSKDIASEIKYVTVKFVGMKSYTNLLLSSLQQQLTEAQAAFQSRSQEYDLKRRELQGIEAQYREADVGCLVLTFSYALTSFPTSQAKLKKLKSGNDLTERQMSKIDMELEQAVPADMTVFEENIEVRHRIHTTSGPVTILISL